MRIFDLISMTFKNLLRRKMRTMLTVTGVIVGTCSIVVMVSLGIGQTVAMEERINSMGDLTQIEIYNYSGSAENADQVKLNDDTIQQIKNMPGVAAITPYWNPPNMSMKLTAGRNDRYQYYLWGVQGVYSDTLADFGYTTSEGTLLEPSTGKKINLLFGSECAYEFSDTKQKYGGYRWKGMTDAQGNELPPYVDPMKDKMTLLLESNETDENGDPKYPSLTYEANITGVLSAGNGRDQNPYTVFMDIEDLRELYKAYAKQNKIKETTTRGGTDIYDYSRAIVKAASIEEVAAVDEAIQELGFDTYSLESVRKPMMEQMQQQQLFLGGIGAISLLVAAIGISNTMVMSIYERPREIGVMKVLGCKLGNIRTVFLMEAGLIGFWGGVIGVAISMGLSKLLNYVVASGMLGGNSFGGMLGGMGSMGGELSVIPTWLALSAIVFATLIGLVSGFSPANRAVKISALEAIKHE